ncbi:MULTISPECIES: hypothetical protein [Pseudomonadaceae]|uniref:hypothetical protein n=1 Tax=Pseudomonadaceae TaxID=135621 RepID=UPI001ADCD2C4|nr:MULTISPECIES: hypothetical protein [Pseudomonas aeruginosa group]MBO8337237.1 hypothetical protein [Pseudomonas aeruginosa]BDC78469.1 hypothetical protein MRCP2_p2040 [Pseudomonas alcaligenes]HBO6962530.1 hypothetical protein [Pseudomonas aeruginosa]HBO7218195.1 hypothetical protein [Pseudomonas aeruginosa]HCF4079442.1 hypothetical protein [Pseudomonas aeruginosa]
MKTIILSDDQHAILVAELIGIDRSKRSREHGVVLDHLIDAVQGNVEAAYADAAQRPDTSCFVEAAMQLAGRGVSGDDIEFDDNAQVDQSFGGAFVSARIWVRNCDAGIPDLPNDLVYEVLDHLEACEQELSGLGNPVTADQIQFVEDLFGTHAHRIERLAGRSVEPLVSRLIFDGVMVEKKLSTVIKEVADAAKATGYSAINLAAFDLWLEEYGDQLDRELHQDATAQ